MTKTFHDELLNRILNGVPADELLWTFIDYDSATPTAKINGMANWNHCGLFWETRAEAEEFRGNRLPADAITSPVYAIRKPWLP